MLKKKALRKIFITSVTVVILLLVYVMPTNTSKSINTLNIEKKIEYQKVVTSDIYLLSEEDLLVKVNSIISETDNITEKVKDVLDNLLMDTTVPKGLKRLIPKNTKVISISVNNGIVDIEFSKELLNVEEKYNEKLIEAIVFSIFEIKEVKEISIFINGENINKHFSNIPITITRDFGINKKYDITGFKDIQKVVIYYVTKIEDNNYYVPITNYVNDDKDKIKIIIESLATNYIYEPNLISFLNNKTELINYEIKDDIMTLNFNNSIFINNSKILEEVIYTLGYSIFDSYDVDKVIFNVENNLIKVFSKLNT